LLYSIPVDFQGSGWQAIEQIIQEDGMKTPWFSSLKSGSVSQSLCWAHGIYYSKSNPAGMVAEEAVSGRVD
jgi:hypothetical protein